MENFQASKKKDKAECMERRSADRFARGAGDSTGNEEEEMQLLPSYQVHLADGFGNTLCTPLSMQV
jgi:hypothetical protein